MKITNSVAIVTGAASGLGAATANLLGERGMRVIGIDLEGAIEQNSATMSSNVSLTAADVTSEQEVMSAIGLAGQIGLPLRLVVNCAGIGPSRRILSSRGVHDLELFRRIVDVNLVGTFNVLRLAAEQMRSAPADDEGQRGLIVNTASIAAYEGQIGQVAYAASKGAIVSMTLAAARDLARYGIRVNTIAPGIVDTPLLRSLGDGVIEKLSESVPFPARLARVGEFAQLVAMIADHDYLNGETVRMDGALRMGPQ